MEGPATDGAQPIRILIAEDEEHLGVILEHFLRGRGYAVTMCRDGRAALAALRRDTFDVALVDIVMPELDGLEVLRHLEGEPEPPEVIIITGNGTIDTAITAIKLGAYDYISKPYRMAEIDVMVRRAWEKRELGRANVMLRRRLPPLPAVLEAVSPPMAAAAAALAGAARTAEPVTLRGEPGAGKSHCARWLHAAGAPERVSDALVEVTAERVRSVPGGGSVALFGEVVRGDPSGSDGDATPRNAGALSLAERGTVVVDVWALDQPAIRLLRDAITQGWYVRVGGDASREEERIPLRTRVVLCERTGAGSRATSDGPVMPGLAVVIPALRDRREDLPALAASLLAGTSVPTLLPDATGALAGYAWPGNVRELRAVLARVAALPAAGAVRAPELQAVLAAGALGADGSGATLAELERAHIETMLVRAGWHQGRAAEALGISTKTLYRKMREYGFTRPRRRRLGRPRDATA